MNSIALAQSASLVDPASIESRVSVGENAELMSRRRPPGGIRLTHGQKEHLLMSTVGKPVEGKKVISVLQTDDGRREWQSCPQGHVSFVPAGFPMEWDWSYRSESVHLMLLPKFLVSVGAEFEKHDGDYPRLRPLFRIFDQGLNSLLRQLREESTHLSPGKDLVTSSLLQLIAARIYRLSRKSHSISSGLSTTGRFSDSDCQKSIEILNDRMDENIALADLAAEFNLSSFHFARVFKRATGFPPHEYQLQLRIARACDLLCRNSRKTITEIACELGFADESHFRRHFRRIVGTTPSAFRKQQ